MPLPSFAATVALPVEELRRLLVEGEPIERVWSAWSLGLKLGASGGAELVAAVGHEPEAGVRRHMVVVLASSGEVRSITAMATHDPDMRVRATALRYLTQLADPNDRDTTALLMRTVDEGSPLLQQACIEGLSWTGAPELWAAVERRVGSKDADVRRAAYQAAMERPEGGGGAVGLATQFLCSEPEKAERARAVKILLSVGGRAAVASLLDREALSSVLLEELLEVMTEIGKPLVWESLEGLFSRIPVSGHHRIVRVLDESGIGPQRTRLLALFVREILDPNAANWQLRTEIAPKLDRALEQNRAPLSSPERELHRDLEAYVARLTAEAAADPEAFDLSDDPTEDAWFLEKERHILAQLAGLPGS